MAKRSFTFTHSDGRVSKRGSERPYTHVITGRIDLAAYRANIMASTTYGESWDYQHKMAQVKVGERMWADRPWPMKQEDADKYAAFMATNPDRAAYVEKCRQDALASLAKKHGTGDKSPDYVLQWSMSEANARKGMASHTKYNIDVQIRPVDALEHA